MSHLTLQEVIERINKANAPVKDRRTNDKRVEDQPHRPEFYIPRMKRIANLMFSG
jgi:hypothetical protein